MDPVTSIRWGLVRRSDARLDSENDLLQTIQGTRTILNDLTDWSGLHDVTGGRFNVPFGHLPECVERWLRRSSRPNTSSAIAGFIGPTS